MRLTDPPSKESLEAGSDIEHMFYSSYLQVASLEAILKKSPLITGVLNGAHRLDAPNWYLGAGCISQTVWNELHGYDLTSNIKDFDLVYCDTGNLSYEAEDTIIKRASGIFGDHQC